MKNELLETLRTKTLITTDTLKLLVYVIPTPAVAVVLLLQGAVVQFQGCRFGSGAVEKSLTGAVEKSSLWCECTTGCGWQKNLDLAVAGVG